jgi:hypothetical protein
VGTVLLKRIFAPLGCADTGFIVHANGDIAAPRLIGFDDDGRLTTLSTLQGGTRARGTDRTT